MAAVADCKRIFDSNVANINRNYDTGVIDISTAKILYNRELNNLYKCSGGDNSVSGIPNPYEITIVNYKFVKQLIIIQGPLKTTFIVGSIVKGDRLDNGNIQITLNDQKIEIDALYVTETGEAVTIITSEKDLRIRKMNNNYSPLQKIAMGVLIILAVIVFVKILKII